MAALREYCEPENKRKGTESEWEGTCDDLMELNNTQLNQLNYIYFETDSVDVCNKSDEDLW